MRAIAYTTYGGPEVTQLIDAAIPEPGVGEVQVRVRAVGLNPIDYHQRQGELQMVHPHVLPVIGGNEFSGTVSKLGSDVSSFQIGDHVVCRCVKSKWGAMGEFVVMPSTIVAKAPSTISLSDAAGLPLAGLTAHQCLEALKVDKGDRVLITGGSGGVGLFAIQLAKLRSAHVTTTASPAGFDAVRTAGADDVVDYRREKVASREQFDKVFDTVGGDEALATDVIPTVKPGGTVISVGGPQTPGCLDAALTWWKRPLVNTFLRYKAWTVSSAASRHGVTYQYIFMTPDGPQLQKLCDRVDRGELKVTIDSRYPMDGFKEAFERLESRRAKGKVLIEFPE